MGKQLIYKADAIKLIDGMIADATSHGIYPRLDPEYVKDGIKSIPAVEPNLLIAPETIERGDEVYIGEDIVVVHQEDYMDIKCKAMMWDEYGEEPKHGEWERIPYSFAGGFRCSCCGTKACDNYWSYCPNCGARMKGADDAD